MFDLNLRRAKIIRIDKGVSTYIFSSKVDLSQLSELMDLSLCLVESLRLLNFWEVQRINIRRYLIKSHPKIENLNL